MITWEIIKKNSTLNELDVAIKEKTDIIFRKCNNSDLIILENINYTKYIYGFFENVKLDD